MASVELPFVKTDLASDGWRVTGVGSQMKEIAYRISIAFLAVTLLPLLTVVGLYGTSSEAWTERNSAYREVVEGARGAPTPVYEYRIVRVYPHDPGAFTQGLVFDGGFLFESTGLNGRSTLRKVELDSGKILKSYRLPAKYFGEGVTEWQGTLVQLTWRSKIGFVYDKESFNLQSEFNYPREGWGITHNGKALIVSDGSPTLRFLNPTSFTEIGNVRVTDNGAPVSALNELEFIKGEIFANVWLKDFIARINPETGKVAGWIDLTGLKNTLESAHPVDILNGIAYDAVNDRVFVTGKLWPKLFEIELVPRDTTK
jgi:glutamine cyclotransferase